MSIFRLQTEIAIAMIIAIAIYLAPVGEALSGNSGQTHVLEIKNLQFVPAEINVSVGDTIRWVNSDIVPHTATANDKSWNSNLIAAGQAWEMVVERDTFVSYFCEYHPGMKAAIKIKVNP